MECQKRGYESVARARAAHARAGYRLRVYLCAECGLYHTTNADKGSLWDVRYGGSVSQLDGMLAPTMTWEELTAAAERKRRQVI